MYVYAILNYVYGTALVPSLPTSRRITSSKCSSPSLIFAVQSNIMMDHQLVISSPFMSSALAPCDDFTPLEPSTK